MSTPTYYPLWSNHEIIFNNTKEGWSILWGNFMDNPQKCLGIRYEYFPYKQTEKNRVPTYLVLPDLITHSTFEKILSRAVLEGQDKAIIDKIVAAMKVYESY